MADHHVHFVGKRRRDHHIRIARTGPIQHVRIAGKAGQPLHIQCVRRAAHQIGVAIDDGDIVALPREVPGNLPAHLPRAADNYLHIGPYPLSGLNDRVSLDDVAETHAKVNCQPGHARATLTL